MDYFFKVRVEEKAEVMFGAEWEARVIERFCRSIHCNIITF